MQKVPLKTYDTRHFFKIERLSLNCNERGETWKYDITGIYTFIIPLWNNMISWSNVLIDRYILKFIGIRFSAKKYHFFSGNQLTHNCNRLQLKHFITFFIFRRCNRLHVLVNRLHLMQFWKILKFHYDNWLTEMCNRLHLMKLWKNTLSNVTCSVTDYSWSILLNFLFFEVIISISSWCIKIFFMWW